MSNHRTVDLPDASSHKPVPDLNDIEMVFGTPNSPKNGQKPDVHFISNERLGGDTNKHNNGNESEAETTHPLQPLLEPDKEPPKPPLAGPEIDDLDDHHHPELAPYPGIDDGLLEPDNHHGHGEGGGTDKEGREGSHDSDGTHHPTHDEGVGTDDGKWWPSHDEPDHPYGFGSINGLEPRFGVDDRPLSPVPYAPDVNTYQQKKNLAQGMMDLALLSANANQLRYVLESSNAHPYFFPSIVFISLSIVLQIAVGVGLIMNSRYDVTDKVDICKADKINNMTVLGVFLVTIVNVFITSFSVASPPAITVSNVQQAG